MAVTPRFVSTLLAACALVVSSTPRASADDFWMLFQNQRVTLFARDMPVSQILDQWARIGGSTVVNADAVKGGPVTLRLIDVPEREALEILLRGADGYIVAERETEEGGPSTFSRILILRRTALVNPPQPGSPVAEVIAQQSGDDVRRTDAPGTLGLPGTNVQQDSPGAQGTSRMNVQPVVPGTARVMTVGGMPAVVPPVLPPGTFVGLGTISPGPGQAPQTVPMLFRQGEGATGRPGETPAPVPITQLSPGPVPQP